MSSDSVNDMDDMFASDGEEEAALSSMLPIDEGELTAQQLGASINRLTGMINSLCSGCWGCSGCH